MKTTVGVGMIEEVRIDLRAGELLTIATSRTHDGARPLRGLAGKRRKTAETYLSI